MDGESHANRLITFLIFVSFFLSDINTFSLWMAAPTPTGWFYTSSSSSLSSLFFVFLVKEATPISATQGVIYLQSYIFSSDTSTLSLWTATPTPTV